MPGELERKNNERTIVLVVISLNAAVTVLLIAGMAHSLTRITQQQHEITNLRKLLNELEQVEHKRKEQKTAKELGKENSFEDEISAKSKKVDEPGKKVEDNEEDVDLEQLVSHSEMPIKRKCCGMRGKRGRQGEKGDRGDKGDIGRDGRDGRDGAKGLPGKDGILGKDGKKGEKGNRGPAAQIELYAESAHMVGDGGNKRSGVSDIRRVTSWTVSHKSGKMDYKDGYLTVGVDGYYNIYSQLYYRDKANTMGYYISIDDSKVLKAVHSVIHTENSGKDQTQYISGVFKISKGQNISVSTSFTKNYYFEHSSSYFGAFMVHR